jgi:hypothetical protein
MKSGIINPKNVTEFLAAVPPGNHYCFREQFMDPVPVTVLHVKDTAHFKFRGETVTVPLYMMPMTTRFLIDSSVVVHMPAHMGRPITEEDIAITPTAESLLERMERTDLRKQYVPQVSQPPRILHIHCPKCHDRGWIPSICLEGDYPLNSRVSCDCQKPVAAHG